MYCVNVNNKIPTPVFINPPIASFLLCSSALDIFIPLIIMLKIAHIPSNVKVSPQIQFANLFISFIVSFEKPEARA